jgi:hypothetical protein
MPCIRSVTISDDTITFSDKNGSKTFNASQIPPQFNNIVLAETYINNTWIPANVTDYQMKVHIFSMNPMRYTIGTWDLGMTIPLIWWSE